jgi:hypothetical protein
MHAYTPLKAYTPARRSGTMGFGMIVDSVGGGMPQLAGNTTTMPQLAAPAQGFKNTPYFAADGGMNVVAERFRRF